MTGMKGAATSRSPHNNVLGQWACLRTVLAGAYEASLLAAVPLIWAAGHNRLGHEDAPELPRRLRINAVAAKATRAWDEAEAKCGKPSLFRVLIRVGSLDLAIGALTGVAQGLTSSLVRPLVMKLLIDGFTKNEPMHLQIFWTALLGLSLLLEGICSADSRYFGADTVGFAATTSIAVLVQRHAARLSSCLTDTKISVVNLVGNDAVRLMENQKGLSLIFFGVSSVAGGIAALLLMLGPMGLVGLLPMLLLLLCNFKFAWLAKDAEHRNLELVDARMHIMNQVVHGIKAIKLTAWEEKYMKLMKVARERECIPLKQWRIYVQTCRNVGRINPILASAALFIALAFVDPKKLARPAEVFAAANVFLSLRLSFIIVPEAGIYLATLFVTLRRCEAFMRLPCAEERPQPALAAAAQVAVSVKGASFAWPDGARETVPMLEGLHFSAQLGELVAVIGDVGSGKSSLLAGLLGDLPLRSGSCEVLRPIGWVPQRPFVLSGTLHWNVTMGRKGDLPAALRMAALEEDVERLGGVGTEVGERGVTLSGGQAQRLALARAIYGSPAVLLADDPLSAVDTKSSAAIFAAVEALARSGSCVVMALNQLHLLPRFDRIVALRPACAPVVVEVADGLADSTAIAAIPGELGAAVGQIFATAGPLGLRRNGRDEPDGQEDLAEVVVQDENMAEGLPSPHPTALVVKDQRSTGGMKARMLRQYIRGMGTCYAILCPLTCILTYGAMGFTDRWLAIWVGAAEEAVARGEELHHNFHAAVYVSSCVAMGGLLFLTSYAFAEAGVRSSRNLHQLCIERLMHAPLDWFESMPSGRILSRFSSDVALVDQHVAQWADNLAQFTCNVVLIGVQTLVVVPWCTMPFVVAFLLFLLLVQYTQRCTRDVKRLANDSMSPLLTTLAETQFGRQSLRVMDLQGFMTGLLHEKLNSYGRLHVGTLLPVEFSQLACTLIAIIVCCSTAAFCLLNKYVLEAPLVALALTYSFLVPYFLQFYVQILNRFLVSLTGLERLLHYADLESEAAWHQPGEEGTMGEQWPSAGALAFEGASLTYRTGLAPALEGVSFQVPGGHSLGVVGRSGAGKSSLLSLFFRLREPTAGRVLIDGVDISRIGLQVLRRRLAILPQEPLLFPGSCRENLDPFGDHSDEQVRATLASVGLSDLVESPQDASPVRPGGGNLTALSIGERQLLALARLMLRQEADSRVVLFDEPTSSVDAATDQRVQEVLRRRFAKSTVLTVAHRLQTVLGCDRILVLSAGRVAELGPPGELLADATSQLAELALEAGLTGPPGDEGL